MVQIIFFTTVMLALLAGHAAFWYVFIRFFHITSLYWQIFTAATLFILYVNAIVSSYVVYKWDNRATRYYYILSMSWVGVSFNLCLVAALVAILKMAGWTFGFSLPDLFLKILFLGGAAGLTLFGLYRVWKPKITEYTVYIKDLPEAWDNKTVVHLSDVHLGAVYRKRFFSRLIDRINDMQPEAVFITGDLFDGMESDFSWLNHPFTKLQSPKGIYYCFGNHDLYLGFNRVIDLLEGNPVEVLDNRMTVVDGLQIIGISYSFNSDFNLEAEILNQVNYDPAKPSVLLFHVPRNINLARKVGIDLQLSGHTHDGQLWPFNYIVNWAHQGHGYGFFQKGDFSLVVNSGAGSWGPPLRTAARSEIVKIILKKKQA
ncbi:MAG: metallophosphoesterase [Patescibacteria group bacterium]